MRRKSFYPFYCIVLLMLASCANISHPTGGDKDVKAPILRMVTPPDSQLNTRVKKIELKFDEFVQVTNAAEEVHISPILTFAPTVEALSRKVIVKIVDSLLQDNTTYRISFGKAIGDIHENNPFVGYQYIFSTGSYFDSLKLSGNLINAATGLKDSNASILLYDAKKSDSAVLREKPMYMVKADGNGYFYFDGLPDKAFKIYALKDKNNNLMYDGTDELIAFADESVHPKDSAFPAIQLFLFSESDSLEKAQQQIVPDNNSTSVGNRNNNTGKEATKESFTYSVSVDTTDKRKRTKDITAPIEIVFSNVLKTFNKSRVSLMYDSAGTSVEANYSLVTDSSNQHKLQLQTAWKENTLYTLRLLKDFATDSAGTEAMPSKYSFLTKQEADYAKLQINIPTKFYGEGFVFTLLRDEKPFYQNTITDSIIRFKKLPPGDYTQRIIIDANKNGKWDHGKLLEKKQPETVIPDNNRIKLKAGWENIVDFKPSEISLPKKPKQH